MSGRFVRVTIHLTNRGWIPVVYNSFLSAHESYTCQAATLAERSYLNKGPWCDVMGVSYIVYVTTGKSYARSRIAVALALVSVENHI